MSSPGLAELLAAVHDRKGPLQALTQQLVAARSDLGAEEDVQRLVAERLAIAGFSVARVRPTADHLSESLAGYPPMSYDDRTCVVGRIGGSGAGRSLHLSGHCDVVPVESPERWSSDPWGGTVADGRLWGRGAGDMKGGLASYLVAVEAVLDTLGTPPGELLFSSVIEEECGGNGMLAVLRSGHTADATLIGEPTGLVLDHGGAGVIWATVRVEGMGRHAGTPQRPASGPIDDLMAVVGGLRSLERRLNEENQDDPFQAISPHPYVINLGAIHGGVWPSSEPSAVSLDFRVGFGLRHVPDEIQSMVREVILESGADVQLEFRGFRAPAYHHSPDTEFACAVELAHEHGVGGELRHRITTATTDARWIEKQCYCYGPVAGNIHGIDEWVDIGSLLSTAATVATLTAAWCGYELTGDT